MALMNVNPTRMELTKLKARLTTAVRGHKLLKDKRDELVKQFMNLVKDNKEMRLRVEKMLSEAQEYFLIASMVMPEKNMDEALMYPSASVDMNIRYNNIMSVEVPVFEFVEKNKGENTNIYPYGFSDTSGELDGAIKALSDVMPHLLQLAAMEKSAQLLADEIEKTRRRVNALEYVMIPDLQQTIKYIIMKLGENERGNQARLMKVKDMMIKDMLEKKNAQ